ncbi:Armadillo/beta-catenin-like repeat family protein [Brugia malayi]|uniref:Armadillo/beta-catenin-like repeat family protein n=1 Tax=Brugia malayi TaxID=6279 RepID=A0A0J9YC06_BRUMA|nr:Armadillo/beta-catenin-like repeat family protein [Brugia malayi]CDQ05911.1 Bm8098, isoform a [Brugia malayi]VIP00158.1 Armadillo/beta-catenin-like repeat family protein [Brugia malayi]
MNSSPHDYVPHCSPAEQMPNMMQVVAENRHFSIGTMVSPKSSLDRPSVPQQQHLFNTIGNSTRLSPIQAQSIPASSQMPSRSAQVPLSPPLSHHYQQQQEQPASTGNADIPSNATNAMFRVQMWSSNFDSGIQSMNHSSAPSVLSVSSLRAGSQISTMSDDAHSRIELTDQQQIKFENISSDLEHGSQDGETQNAVPELIHLLNDTDEVVVQRAATTIQTIAKIDSEEPLYAEPYLRAIEVITALKDLLRTKSNKPAIIKPTLGALFHISERHDGLENILKINDQTKGSLLIDIIEHIKFTGGSALRYAILTFHTIIAVKPADGHNIEVARTNGALQALTQFLDRESNEKLLSVIVECVRLLCDKSQTQRALFLQLNGPSKLLYILRVLCYEGLLWRTTQLLKIFSNGDPQAIVKSGGYDVLHKQLEHASQRLIISTLECIRNMSDSRSNSQNTIQTALYRVLISSYSIPASAPNQQQRVEDIQERGLATLRQLCVGHTHQVEAQKAVLQQQYAADFLLRKLTEMRPSILKQTLQILNKAALQDTNLLFREIRLKQVADCETNFMERIALILKVACDQLPLTKILEEVRVADLIQLSLSTLQLLCRDSVLLNQISYCIRRSDFLMFRDRDGDCATLLPVFCLYQNYVKDENLNRSALGLIHELSSQSEQSMPNRLMSAACKVGDPSVLYQNFSLPSSSHRLVLHSAQLGGQPNVPCNGQQIQYPQQNCGANNSYNTISPSASVVLRYPSLLPQQTPLSTPTSLTSYSNLGGAGIHAQSQTSSPPQQQVSSDNQAVMYGRGDPSQNTGSTSNNNNMEYSLGEVWSEDLSGLSISDDPFATMFTQHFDLPQQRHHLRSTYLSARGNFSPLLNAYCCPGPSSTNITDQLMESYVHMGSPDAPASWNDPMNNSNFSDFQM